MRKLHIIGGLLILIFLGLNACREIHPFEDSELDERMTGGDTYTIFDRSSSAFGTMIPGMTPRDQFVHELGDKFFESKFVTAPAPVNPGLGPIFNNTSCTGCHQRDGRGRPPFAGESLRAMLFRISIPGKASDGGPKPVPGFGAQLQDKAVAGIQHEADVSLSYTFKEIKLADGAVVSLRIPHYKIINPYKTLPANLLFSPRIASQTLGTGLIEAIPEAEILSHADPDDADHDGISGRVNNVYDPVLGKVSLGRYGWKANVATLKTQVASAFQQDMGISNYVFPNESSEGQPQFPQGQQGVNLPDSILDAVTFYMRTLAVPARRDVNNMMNKHGAAIFQQIGCAKCHITTFTTKVDVVFPLLSAQVIHPYSDFLLHDMGTELADGRPDYEAGANEWRTSPLWGIGLTEKVSGYTFYMHDGRARNLTEAIVWHGGEGKHSRDAFIKLDKSDRDALISFLNSL